MTDVVIPLRRNLRFQTFWTGSVSATLGQAVGGIAYPLAIVTMTGSPGKAALFSAVQITGMLVAGLPVGSLADRYDSRRLALVAYAICTMVACAVAIALAGRWLTLPLLVAGALVLGAGQALSGAANILLLRSIVPGEQLTLALTQDEVRINGATLAGPALAGALYGLHHVAPSPSPPPLSSWPSPRPSSCPRDSPAPRPPRKRPKAAYSPASANYGDSRSCAPR
jgi:MFS family permease